MEHNRWIIQLFNWDCDCFTKNPVDKTVYLSNIYSEDLYKSF